MLTLCLNGKIAVSVLDALSGSCKVEVAIKKQECVGTHPTEMEQGIGLLMGKMEQGAPGIVFEVMTDVDK